MHLGLEKVKCILIHLHYFNVLCFFLTILSNLHSQANEQIHQENFGRLPLKTPIVTYCCHYSFSLPTLTSSLHFVGTASVIIALTDGELQEHQLIAAQQEVMSIQAADIYKPKGSWFLIAIA